MCWVKEDEDEDEEEDEDEDEEGTIRGGQFRNWGKSDIDLFQIRVIPEI